VLRSALLRTSCGYPTYFLRLEVLLTAGGTQKVRGKAAATNNESSFTIKKLSIQKIKTPMFLIDMCSNSLLL